MHGGAADVAEDAVAEDAVAEDAVAEDAVAEDALMKPLPLTTAEFVSMWQATEKSTGVAMTDIEKGSLVRTGNTAGSVSGSTQDKAQYGRLFFGATQTIAELTSLKASDRSDRSEVFVDIPCGVGKTTMQMACTARWVARRRGIELMQERHIVGHLHTWPAAIDRAGHQRA